MKNNNQVRTRYAPSPTGRLHLGGARTALFNYLFAKNQNGKFLLRIEDTDLDRNLKDGANNQLSGLKWLNIIPDVSFENEDEYGPYFQSKRIKIYDKYVDELLNKKLAYKCWCSKEELEASADSQRKRGIKAPQYDRKCFLNPIPKKGINPVIRLFVEKNETLIWTDLVRGEIKIPSSSLGDFVIRKSNGIPTYNFANVIDDHLMKISHVFRGEEHISNTGKQLYLYKILDWKPPKFGHLTVITNYENKKLSKRDETVEQFIDSYKEKGYLPEAIFNFLSLLGWSPGSEKEIFTHDELIKIFKVKGFSKSPSKFNHEKLKWTNNYYIKALSFDKYKEFLLPFISKEILNKLRKELDDVLSLFKSQIREGIEIKELIKIFTILPTWNNSEYNFSQIDKSVIEKFYNSLESTNFNEEDLKSLILNIGSEFNLKGKSLMFPLRFALTGQNHGPELIKIILIFKASKTKAILERLFKDEIYNR